MLKRIGRAFPPPPGLTWRFVWVPLLWALLMAGAWGGVQWWLSTSGDLNAETFFASAQVFTGLAGIGAAVIALAAIARQFEVPSVRLGLSLSQVGGGLFDIVVSNDGTAEAAGVSLELSPCVSTPGGWRHDDRRWDVGLTPGPPPRYYMRWSPPLAAHGGRIRVERIEIPSEVTVVTARADNGGPAEVQIVRGT